MDILKILMDKGQIEVFQMEHAQIAKHVEASYQDLLEARTTITVSDKAGYLFAYTAMLKIARALLFLKGYRPKGKGQHETVVEAAGAILGKEFESLTGKFDRMRRKRNQLIYDIGGLTSHSESEDAFKTAEKYLDKVRKFMESEDHQIRLDFKI